MLHIIGCQGNADPNHFIPSGVANDKDVAWRERNPHSTEGHDQWGSCSNG